MKLYSYFRSSAAFRVRIALNLKGIDHTLTPINLKDGEQTEDAYKKTNPHGLIPTLDHDGFELSQSLAIIDYLERTHPQAPLFPKEPQGRAVALSMALAIGCDIHPINNLRILKYLKSEFDRSQDEIDSWYRHWISEGFKGLELMVGEHGSQSRCFGEDITIADVFLAPQMWNARRFGVDLAPFPRLVEIDASLMSLDAFKLAAPENQPDFPSDF